MARASYLESARAMALATPPLAWFCAAAWPDLSPPLTNDHGMPLADVAAKNALRKEVQKLAASIHETNVVAAEGA